MKMRPFGRLLPDEEARNRLLRAARPVEADVERRRVWVRRFSIA